MGIVRSALTAFLIPALLGPTALAQEDRATRITASRENFAAVKADYDAARKQWTQEIKAARDARQKSDDIDIAEKTGIKPFQFRIRLPDPAFSPRFLAVAENDPEGPEALEAIKMALRTSSSSSAGDMPLGTRARAIKVLADNYTTSSGIRDVVRLIAWYDEPEARALIDDVIARNPDRLLHVAALQSRAQRLALRMRVAENLKKPDAVRALGERPQYRGHVAAELAAAERARAELDTIEKILGEKYADMVADMRIGSRIGPLVSEDLDGKTVSLDASKGKVVVLDVWATWCGPCRKMIPHEREMVARLKCKPFVLISISVDAKKQTLTDFLTKEPMPWEQWWNGAEGKLIDKLSIEHYPTIFVLDAEGVIRYKNVELAKDPNAELEKAVEELLKETEKKTAGPATKEIGKPAKAL